MIVNVNVMRLMVVCAVGACTVAPSGTHDEMQGETMDEVASPSTEAVVPPTPAMLAAALSGDPDAIVNAATPSGCMAATTCPDPKSCGTWSTSVECNETCLSSLCQGGAEGRFGRAFSNSFRVCFDAAGHSCTEWQLTSILFCGC
jgi:hypothetical protein